MKPTPTEDNPIPYAFPLRVGRKKGRAILDANSYEVVIFPEGSEYMAQMTCDLWNEFAERVNKAWEDV